MKLTTGRMVNDAPCGLIDMAAKDLDLEPKDRCYDEGLFEYDEDFHDLRSVETEFPAIVFNDALTSEVALSCEPTNYKNATISPTSSLHIDDLLPMYYTSKIPRHYHLDTSHIYQLRRLVKDFKNEFPAIAYNDALTSKLDFYEPTDNDDDDKVDIKQFSEDNVINTDVDAYAQGSNKLLEISHDTISKILTAKFLSRN
ncbi:hypothetical protein Tco_1355074 [Tanacetum coccineum]